MGLIEASGMAAVVERREGREKVRRSSWWQRAKKPASCEEMLADLTFSGKVASPTTSGDLDPCAPVESLGDRGDEPSAVDGARGFRAGRGGKGASSLDEAGVRDFGDPGDGEADSYDDLAAPKTSEPIMRALWSAAHRVVAPRTLMSAVRYASPAYNECVSHFDLRGASNRIALTIDDAPSDAALMHKTLDALDGAATSGTLTYQLGSRMSQITCVSRTTQSPFERP